MESCSIIPQIRNNKGEVVDSRLFQDILAVSSNREEAKDRYLMTRTDEFKNWFGDWINNPGDSSRVIDENGEPLLVWHGTANKFDTFDKAWRGSTTGKSIDNSFDSEHAFFFSDNQNVSFVYSIFARQEELKGLAYSLRLITSTLPWEAKNKVENYNKTRERFPKFASYVDGLKSKGLNSEQIMSELKKQRAKYEDLSRKYSNGGAISNSRRYYRDAEKSIDKMVSEKSDILKGNYKSISPYGQDYSFSLSRGGYDSMYIGIDGLIYGGFKDIPDTQKFNRRNISSLSSTEFDELVSIFREAIENGKARGLEEIKEGGFTPILLPTFLNIRNPIVKDFEGKSFVDQMDSEGARGEMSKLIIDASKTGKDGGIFKNVADPEVGTTYAIFEGNQIKSLYNSGNYSKEDDNIYRQQQSNQPKSSKELDSKVEGFLKTIGVTIQSVKNITDSEGNKLDAIGVANLLSRTIQVVEGEAKLDTLPHEATHFLLEILKQNGSPLYNSMKSEIESYDIYKETLQEYGKVYNGNLEKIKDEAITRVIASIITDTFEQENKKSRVATWWNRVLNFIKSKLGLINKDDLNYSIISNNPFGQAADIIYNRSSNFSFDENDWEGSDEKYYQLFNGRNVEDRIKNRWNIGLGDNGKYEVEKEGKTVEVANRVSDKIKQQDTREKSKIQKDQEELQKTIGLKGHQDLDNIVQRLVAQRDGKIAPSAKINTNQEVYNTLQRYVEQMLQTIPTDSRILTNQTIYDEKSDTAGTPNMLVIHPDGKVDILQWRFTNTNKQDEVFKRNTIIWNKQLQEYKKILASGYGIKDFGKLRTIPVETKFNDGFFSGIRTGSQDFNTDTNPIPLSEELTGDEKLDRILQKLVKDKTEWENRKSPYGDAQIVSAFNEKKFKELARISKAIADIQLKQDIKEFTNIGLSTIKELSETPINSYSLDNLLELQKTMQFYGKNMLALVNGRIKGFSDTEKQEFNRLVTESQIYDDNIKEEIVKREIQRTGNSELISPQKETGIWNRMFQTVSQQNHPIIKSFWNLVKDSKAKTRENVVQLNEKIKSAIEGLRKAQPHKSGADLFDFMLTKKSNGQLSIIPKFKIDFTNKLNESRAILTTSKDRAERAKAVEFIKKYTTFNKEAYQKAEQEQLNFLGQLYQHDEFKDEKVTDRFNEFRKKYDATESGYSNPKNPYIKVNDDINLHSEQYKNIQSKSELKAFYDLWMENSKLFQDYIGKDLGKNFVWNIHNNLVDSIAENGLGAFTNMSSILDHLEARAGESLGMVDPETGKPLYEIPTYYTDVDRKYNEKTGKWEVDSRNQSRDLGKVLSLVSAMAYNHKYMEEIESSSKALELILQNQQSVLIDNNGNEVKNKLTNQVAKIVGSSDTLQQFNDYMNYYIYGVKSKTKDFTFKVGDRNFSTLAVYNATSKWFIGKALALNPTSIVSNIVGGNANVRIIGAMDKFFNNSQFNKAIYNLLPTRNKHAFSLLSYFDLVDGQNYRKGAENLSTSLLSKTLTYDHLLIGQESGDKLIRNGTLLAMLQSHTFKNGKIQKSVENDTSLIDYIDTSKDKIDFKDIPKEELERFRTKVLAVTDNILGNNSRDDIRLAQLTVLGRALLTFRSWIPRMVDTRFGSLRENEELETYELGRYKTFWNQVITKHCLPLIVDSIKGFGFFGYGGKFGDRTINRAKELYSEYMEKNPQSKMTEQDYINLHLSNMKGNMMEIYITGMMLGALMAAQPDKGEHLEQGSLRKWFALQMDRNLSELTFFYSPAQFNKIIKSPIPLVNTYLDIYNLGKAMVHGTEEVVTGTPISGSKKNEFRKAAFSVVPGLAGFESIYSFMDDNYNKSNSIGTDSKNR